MKIKHVISISGGKDSTATLLVALQRVPHESLCAIFCDTGNEHEAVYEYLNYLELALDIKINRLKADFSNEINAKRKFISRDQRIGRIYNTVEVLDKNGNTIWARNERGQLRFKIKKKDTLQYCALIPKTKKIGGGRRVRWTNKAKRRALSALFPSGNPFLDLCLWKGKFPSRKSQFCTEELKRNIAVSFQLDLIDAGYSVISWIGVRRDESANRQNAKLFERCGPKLWAFRPLVEWSALDVFDYCAKKRIQPNPLYLQGCSRVGCMPCINSNKAELRQINSRWPEHVQRIADWENLVCLASKRGASTFFPAPGETRTAVARGNILQKIAWAKTTRGGRQYDLLGDLVESTACASSYGLCE